MRAMSTGARSVRGLDDRTMHYTAHRSDAHKSTLLSPACSMSALPRWPQSVDPTLYLKRRDGVFGYVSKISSGFYCGREDGVMGSLAARRVFERDWTSVWQAVIVYSSPSIPPRWDSSCATASLAVVIDAFGARGDIERPCGTSIGTIDGEVAGPLGLDGEPRT